MKLCAKLDETFLSCLFLYGALLVGGCDSGRSQAAPTILKIDSTQVRLATFYHSCSGFGQIRSVESTDLLVKFDGSIEFNFSKKSHYRKGELVYSLSGHDVRLEREKRLSEQQIARANFEYWRDIYERKKTLKPGQFISSEEWEKLKRDTETATQEVKAAESAMNYFIKMTQVRAPYDGDLTEIEVAQGEYVTTDTRVGRFLATGRQLTGQYFGEKNELQAVSRIDIVLNDSLRTAGQLAYFQQSIDPETGGRTFWINLESTHSNIEAGSFVKYRFQYAPYQAAAVPDSVVIREHDGYNVVVVRNGKYHNFSVQIGRKSGLMREVLNGPTPGTWIVTTNAFELFYSNLQDILKIED